ncbi:MAG: hypothetical protein J0I12_12745 [Candidatus Eremiobacteraeota bacterium]|nr:hypothetical protein [Candidatus Eremiobacteraeota bacterium]
MRRFFLWLCLTGLIWAEPAPLYDLGQEYQEFRKQRGHFSGGDWNAALDRWDGRKHQVMVELGERLGEGSTRTLLEIMGEPDAREGSNWLYYWRGRHDYLFFHCLGEKVLKAEWWMAGE